MLNIDRTKTLDDALAHLRLVDQRLSAIPEALPHATRISDRQGLANRIKSARLQLSVALELLRDLRGSQDQTPSPALVAFERETARRAALKSCENCFRQHAYDPETGCIYCTWKDA